MCDRCVSTVRSVRKSAAAPAVRTSLRHELRNSAFAGRELVRRRCTPRYAAKFSCALSAQIVAPSRFELRERSPSVARSTPLVRASLDGARTSNVLARSKGGSRGHTRSAHRQAASRSRRCCHEPPLGAHDKRAAAAKARRSSARARSSTSGAAPRLPRDGRGIRARGSRPARTGSHPARRPRAREQAFTNRPSACSRLGGAFGIQLEHAERPRGGRGERRAVAELVGRGSAHQLRQPGALPSPWAPRTSARAESGATS